MQVTNFARDDLADIFDHIASDNLEAAKREHRELRVANGGQAALPERYEVYLTEPYRRRVCGSFSIIYVIERDEVHILTLRHSAQLDLSPAQLYSLKKSP